MKNLPTKSIFYIQQDLIDIKLRITRMLKTTTKLGLNSNVNWTDSRDIEDALRPIYDTMKKVEWDLKLLH